MSSASVHLHGTKSRALKLRGTRLLDDFFRGYSGEPFAVRTPQGPDAWGNGWNWRSSENAELACTIVLNTPEALHAILHEPSELTLGRAFVNGDIDIEGDIFSVFSIAKYVFNRPTSLRGELLRQAARVSFKVKKYLSTGGLQHSAARDRAAISYHYDLPSGFYQSFLGPTMVYSCAYFRDDADSLDAAQRNKLELICRKLDLQAGERFLDIGCGWGSLVLHAASQHDARAQGITLSTEQAAFAAQRIAQADLNRNCAVELRDYRRAPDLPLRFDKVASVGMFEHVGLKNLREYFTVARRLLQPGGLFLNHGIARSANYPPKRDSFIDRYVFPDGELVTLSQALTLAESVGLEVRDVDNLREHYERTLRLWVENLQRNVHNVRRHVSEQTYRIWLIYMAGSAAAFHRGDIALYQVLFGVPGHRASKPPTREHWYDDWHREKWLREPAAPPSGQIA